MGSAPGLAVPDGCQGCRAVCGGCMFWVGGAWGQRRRVGVHIIHHALPGMLATPKCPEVLLAYTGR